MPDETPSSLKQSSPLWRALLLSLAVHLLVLLSLAPLFIEERPIFSTPALQARIVGKPMVSAPARTPSTLVERVTPSTTITTATAKRTVVRSSPRIGVIHEARRTAEPGSQPDASPPAESAVPGRISHVAASLPAAPAVTEASPRNDAEDLRQYRVALAIEARRFRRYPALAREQGWEGVVEVRLEIGSDALPHLQVSSSSGHALLDEAALVMMQQAVRAVPMPAGLRGRAHRLLLPVRFSLEESDTSR